MLKKIDKYGTSCSEFTHLRYTGDFQRIKAGLFKEFLSARIKQSAVWCTNV